MGDSGERTLPAWGAPRGIRGPPARQQGGEDASKARMGRPQLAHREKWLSRELCGSRLRSAERMNLSAQPALETR